MRKNTKLTVVTIAGLFLALVGFQSIQAQGEDAATTPAAPAAEPGTGADAAATPAVDPAVKAPTLDEVKAQWNKNLVWVSFIVDDGRVASQRDYFGAFDKADFDTVVNGGAKGMVKVQQVFYYNSATRQFSRFDAAQGGQMPLLGKSGYFRPESIMRIVPLNNEFVERLAVQMFLDVKGVKD
ncbi:MAG: hypothetical protein ACI8UO_000197 [Verrucomicrobiales bacterium]|jgi:hypothetical protein